MNEKIYDVFTCVKIASLIFLPIALLGAVVGVILGISKSALSVGDILSWIFYIGVWISSFGLFIAAVAFVKPKHMRDLNHQKEWRKHFYKMNLVGVIFTVCFVQYIYLAIIDVLRYYMFAV